ncbi:uncharacterized protein C3orf20 homolog isoform X1 [Neofelis nebulosa]|uniref:uncharacterized protein C3orf20 homolog isoform X1 n=2 Tax=Neofelis nebulosa TaxID=61452 RepID=UPI00272BBCAC|nr:uncharacterized protein C3orf20 homolog isoform X1 [Neofelis nebulosa]XP_058597714.1 uncharacterized protein C3orf20 homolog isoform X1 [Neofelis nebulosa]XP_058597715.1 uncharacterized protein C3orf20 homolog isoform X1 [Neofelis nebulosa]
MEDFTEVKSLDIGPIYFFDQMKPKRKIWEKREHEGHFPHLRYTSRAIYSRTNSTVSKEQKEARLSTVSECEKKDEFHSSGISQISGVSKFSSNLRFTKIYRQKNLFEEYKLIAAEILSELGEILQKYAEYNITFPAGIVNLMNYSWHDLIEGVCKCATKNLKKNNALKRDSKNMTQISTCAREEYHKENHLVKAKKDHPVSSALVKQNQYSQIPQDSHLPVVIHFSLLSKICLENGWIFQHPHSKLEILKWKTILNTAVKRLQEAIIQIKAEEAKLKKEGFNKCLILRHYNDPKGVVKVDNSPKVSQCFWLELLKRKPKMPTVKEADPEMKKFHYALVDGSSLTYYPSGRLAVCQSYSALPWGGTYTNIFSDLPDQVILGTFTPFGCGSISFPRSLIISMMFNQDGGMVIGKKGNIIREWMWPSKGKLDDPVEIWVNEFITVEISGRFAITLVYKWHPQSLTLSLAPVKCKFFHQGLPEEPFPDVNPISKEAMELFKAYKVKCKHMKSATQDKDPSSLTDTMKIATFDPVMDISPMSDITTVIKLRRLQKKVKYILLHWLDYYRFALGIESLYVCKIPKSPQKVIKKQKVSSAKFPLKQSTKEKDENKEYLQYQNTFLKLKGIFQPSPLYCIRKTPVSNQYLRLPLPPIESKDAWFASQLLCPVVLRRTLCGKEGGTCQCGTYSIPEVTDLEYDHLISTQLSSVDQVIIVHVTSAKETDKTIKEMAQVYRKLNRSKSMPCIQSCSDPFRLLKYNITSASKFTGNSCPLLVQRHNVIPGIFLMYIRGKLVFANFIFNGYSTSAKDLQKQIVKTKSDYHTGYFLPNDFRIRLTAEHHKIS